VFNPTTNNYFEVDLEDTVWYLALSPNGRYLAAGGQYERLTIWDLTTRAETFRLSETLGIAGMVWSHDSRYLITGGSQIIVWSPEGERLAEQITVFNDDVAWLPGNYLLYKNPFSNPNVYILPVRGVDTQLEFGRPQAFPSDGSPIQQFAVNDAANLVAAATERTIFVWDATDYRIVATLDHPGQIEALTFSPDGRFLASAGGVQVILWDLTTFSPVRKLLHIAVFDAVWSPSGEALYTSGVYGVYGWETAAILPDYVPAAGQ
jgi:WD40 repeat protein